jgi:hypothetical protein
MMNVIDIRKERGRTLVDTSHWFDWYRVYLTTERTLMVTIGMVVLAMVTFLAMIGFVALCDRV